MAPLTGEQGKKEKQTLESDEEYAQKDEEIEEAFPIGEDCYHGEEAAR